MASHAFTYPLHSGTASGTTVDALTYNTQSVSAGISTAPPQGAFPVSIAGRSYMVDTSFEPYRREAFRHKSIPPLRQSLHFTNVADDGTISTEGLWRREGRSWNLGEGQIYFDRINSDPRLAIGSDASRFYQSKGIDPWTQWQLKLLPDTVQQYNSSNTVKAVRCGAYVYIIDNNTLKFTSSWGTYTTVSGISGTILDVATDGFYIWVLSTSGLYQGIAGNSDGVVTLVTMSLAGFAGSTPSGIIKFIGGRLIMVTNNCRAFAAKKIPQSGGAPVSGVITSGSTIWDLSSTVNTAALPAVIGYLTSSVTSSSTTFNVDYITTAESNNTILYIEGEQVKLNGAISVGGTSMTVSRGQNSTTAVAHAAGTPIYAAPASISTLSALYTHPNPNWTWSAVTSGSSQIYFAGYVLTNALESDPSAVYRSTITTTATTASNTNITPGDLTVPVVALPFPAGEYPTAMRGYLNFIFVGTNKGIRMCQTLNSYDPAGNTGDLKSGPLTPNITHVPTSPVTGIVGHDRYIYWAWNNYDSQSTGLGRLDLTTFVDALAPAYASDAMINGQGTCTYLDWDPITNTPLMSFNTTQLIAKNLTASGASGVMTFIGQHSFVVGQSITTTNFSDSVFNGTWTIASVLGSTGFTVTSSAGNGHTAAAGVAKGTASQSYIFTNSTTSCVTSGYVDSGLITYGISDNKNAISLDVGITNVAGSHGNSSASFTVSVDNGTPFSIGTYSGAAQKATLPFPQQFGEQYRVITTLNAGQDGAKYNNVSPTLNRWTLKALPGIPSGIQIECVILLYEPYEVDGQTVYQDPYVEYAFLEALRQSQQVVTYVEGPFTAAVTVDMIDWLPERRRSVYQGGYHGDLVVTLKTITG